MMLMLLSYLLKKEGSIVDSLLSALPKNFRPRPQQKGSGDHRHFSLGPADVGLSALESCSCEFV
jgi:hypothetical protein